MRTPARYAAVGAGSPFADYATTYDAATERCRSVRTMAAVLSISGKAGNHRLRAKLDAGFASPARVRLEFPAPGRPIFTYVAVGEQATLVLPREGRVLRDAPPAATLEALAGVAIWSRGTADDRRRLWLRGWSYHRGRAFDRAWVAVDAGNVTSWLQQTDGAWQMVAAVRGAVEVRYADFQAGLPATIRLRASPERRAGEAASVTDLTIRLSQVDINEPLGADVFLVDVPAGREPDDARAAARGGAPWPSNRRP